MYMYIVVHMCKHDLIHVWSMDPLAQQKSFRQVNYHVWAITYTTGSFPGTFPLHAQHCSTQTSCTSFYKMAGFECEFVEPPPTVLQTECPVCLHILREPYQAICCGNSFCRECFETAQERSESSCPGPTYKNKVNFACYPNKG